MCLKPHEYLAKEGGCGSVPCRAQGSQLQKIFSLVDYCTVNVQGRQLRAIRQSMCQYTYLIKNA